MKFFAILTLIFLMSCSAPKKDDIDKKVDNLLSQMTLEEKIGQLCCPIGFNLDDESYHCLMDTLPCGGFWAVLRADPWSQKTVETGPDARESALIFNKMQRYAVENTRLGIPIYFAEECPHGLMAVGATVYPTGLGLAATWDEDLLYKVGDNIGEEAANRGAKYAFGPVLDIARDPRWSRVEEGFGEDPYLSGTLGSAVIRGMQNHLAATVKHFAAYGIPEGGHNGAAAQTGPHYLMSDYLANFETAVKNGAKSIMTSYNAIDGIPCSSNSYLLKDVLRKQWGFNGIVFSDLGSIWALHSTHRTAENQLDATAQAINAGVDIDLGASNYGAYLKDAVEQGMVPMKNVDDAVRRILRFKYEIGLFDNPYIPVPDKNDVVKTHGRASQQALETAQKSIVLLKNNGILPLYGNGQRSVSTIAVIGPNADNMYNELGDYTAPQYSDDIVTVLEGIRNRANPGTKIVYAKGCSIRDTHDADFKSAIDAAKSADVTILVVGGSSARDFKTSYESTGAAVVNDHISDMDSGEGYDRVSIELSGLQEDLIAEIAKLHKQLIIIYIEGRPLFKNIAEEVADALLTAFYPGEQGGNAIADVLFGNYNPAGRLPISQPRDTGQIPVYYSQPKPHDYVECSSTPLFSFGYGLSYTHFEYNYLIVNKSDNVLEVSFDVKNIGNYDGDEVVQLYLRDEYATITPAEKLLKGFKRVFIQKTDTQHITLTIPTANLEPGEFTVMVGASSDDIRLKEKIVI
ncbi:MAG: glycoside hydrolase family 3 C-terminal domain-containing protein [Bacteroidales bacterium]|nr:glycoside hydrolase family 3 C-terminal domain-containing protein [Bacteroidales bacterium]